MNEPGFERIVGRSHFAEATETHAIDGVTPRWVVQPGTLDEAVAVVQTANEHGLAIVPRGKGRHLEMGDPPDRFDVLLSTERLDRILDHEPADMTVRVMAGCTIPSLGQALHGSQQWLPLDPPAEMDTTIGGLLATNLSGPLRASQGSARDMLIGIRTIAPDGSIVSGGGRVVKNVAGYDLPKMHVGALGTLGLIYDATFKVRPRPPAEEALSIPCAEASRATSLALEMRDACEPFWLQIVSQTDEAHPWAVVAGAGGRREEVETALDAYRRVARNHTARALPVENAAELRRHIAERVAEPDRFVLRAATLPSQVGRWIEALRATGAREGRTVAIQADLMSGSIRVAIERPVRPASVVEELRPTLERSGGALVVERANAAQKKQLASLGGSWGDAGPGLDLMRGLKQAFDPEGRFSPGRFVGDL